MHELLVAVFLTFYARNVFDMRCPHLPVRMSVHVRVATTCQCRCMSESQHPVHQVQRASVRVLHN